MTPFGARLAAAVAARGPLCAGIDPHPGLLRSWGLSEDVAGLERFAMTAVEAMAGDVAVLKPQSAFFEAHGSAGVAVLERVIAESRAAGALVLLDAKRGDIGSTMDAYAAAYLTEGSPLAADAVTVSPYLGFGALDPALDAAAAHGRGVFVLAMTSNPEGGDVQRAVGSDGRTVAQAVVDAAGGRNAAELTEVGGELGSVGVVVGATVDPAVAPDLSGLRGPVLAPGLGAQGGTVEDLRRVFGPVLSWVLPTTSRDVLRHGPDVGRLREAARRLSGELAATLG
ncbi:orotidine-5'-phosphate decarboxylase [Streptoalloteichus tenebrarius]|uniref:orotidine-5'-phosphate decarboxylase n=1 Tax=Streptoalloteichus tenebrarius (strain ATCC 17920 / DSM 40477 / JCM 4838 / CBS 697.72 / NBRC 16177 / NCIMB 11028 / NRRL B-12390 / A12253. 1 / ISP 5477) TaxID=1933 RepID=UPI003555D25F|nr:orotidine-5'-phosphate decarboxylase [Streptoalloteichus tenebrarius]